MLKITNVGVTVFESYTYQNVKETYDIIVSNPPVRAGKEVVTSILCDAYNF